MNFHAFIFDLNGTMIDDMSYHQEVWYDILVNELGANLSKSEVKSQMYGRNDELIERVFGKGHFTAERINKISHEKEIRYQQLYKPHLQLIDGLEAFLIQAKNYEIPMAIGSAALPININFVLDQLNLHSYFKAIVSADDVLKSKPDPETYINAAKLLDVSPSQCLVFEDAPKGVEAALLAGMKSVVVTGLHAEDEFSKYNNVVQFIPDYTKLSVEHLIL